jgi:hypothetical protein
MSLVSKATARSGINSGRYLVRQYGEDGTQYADLPRLPRTYTERRRAPLTRVDDKVYLILDDCHNKATDYVRIA